MQWLRKAAENGHAGVCLKLAARVYAGIPYAREVGHVIDAAGVASSAGIMEGHDVPPDVMTGVLHGCGLGARQGSMIHSACSTHFAEERRRGVSCATTRVVRLLAI
jgi:hypothetical protein